MTSILATLIAAASLAAAQQPQPEITIYRSWRSPDMTLVEGLFRVDPELLGTPTCSYGVSLAVRDQQGMVLKQETWKGECPQQAGHIAAALETFQFAMPSTRFKVEVSVFPQGLPDNKRTTVIDVEGLPARPLASDLILARSVGYVDKDKAAAWTMRRGTIGLEVPSQLVVDAADAKVAYYLELYPRAGQPLTGAVFGVVRRQDGRELARTQVQKLDAVTEAQPVAGTFPLTGLPQGQYTLELQLNAGDSMVIRKHAFAVATAVAAVPAGDHGWFGTLSDKQIVEMFDAVIAFGLNKTQIELYRSLTPAGKRAFLAREFGPQAPTPDDGQESALDAYLARSAHVRARFAERAGRGEQSGWQTPRGRIWMKLGEPASNAVRARPSSGSPYEIWHYTIGPGYVYLFADDTGMGHFRLIFSNDPNEQSLPDWDRLIGAEAISDLARLGFRPRGGGGAGSQH